VNELLLDKLLDYLKQMQKYIPARITNEFFGFEVGSVRDLNKKVIKKGLLITPYLSIDAINYARLQKYNLIITRIPLFNYGISSLDEKLHSVLFLLLQSHIMVYNIGNLWDYTKEGGIEFFLNAIGLQIIKNIIFKSNKSENLMGFICKYNMKNSNWRIFIENIKRILSLDYLNTYNSVKQSVDLDKLILFFPEEINDKLIIKQAYNNNCEVIISRDIDSECIYRANLYNIKVIKIEYLNYLNIVMERLSKVLSIEFPHIAIEYYKPKEILEQK